MQLCRRYMASWWTLCSRPWRPSPLRCQTWPAWPAAPHGCNPSPCRHATLQSSLFSENIRPRHCQSMACWYLETCFCYCFCLYKSGRLGRNNITHSMHAFMHAQSPSVSLPCSYAGGRSGSGAIRCACAGRAGAGGGAAPGAGVGRCVPPAAFCLAAPGLLSFSSGCTLYMLKHPW